MNFNIYNIIRAALLFIALIFVCVGTGVHWLIIKFGSANTKYFIYGYKSTGGSLIKYKDGPFCNEVTSRMDAAYAFAIISCIVIGFALICVALKFFLSAMDKILGFASLGLSAFGFITTLIAWAIGIGFYHGKLCGANSTPKQLGYDIAGGLALFIVAWIIMIADCAVAVFSIFFGGSGSAAVEANNTHIIG